MVEAVDILNVKDRPDIGFTSEAPRSHLSQSQLEQPGRDMQRAMEQWSRAAEEGGAALEKGAVTAAERQAYGDLAKQKVTRDPQGNIQVLSPANSFFWGEAGRRYEEIVRQGSAAQMGGMLNQQMVEMAARNPLDPAKFKAGSDAVLDTFQQQFGNTPGGAEAVMHGREHQIQHYDWITNRAAENDLTLKRQSIIDTIKAEKQDLLGLAGEPGAENSPDFQKKLPKLFSDMDSLTTDPRFKTSQAAVDLEKKQFATQLAGERIVSVLPKLIDEQGMNAARKSVDEFEKRGDLEPSIRRTIAAQARATLAEATPKWNEENRAFDTKLEGIKKGLRDHTLSPDDPNIQQLVKLEKERGYNRGGELEALVADAPWMKRMGTLTSQQRSEAVGLPTATQPSAAPAHSPLSKAINPDTGKPYYPTPITYGVPTEEQNAASAQSTRPGHYSMGQMEQLARNAGFDETGAKLMASIAQAESSGHSGAMNTNKNGTTDYGLTQINSTHGEEYAKAALNPQEAFKKAFELSKGGKDFSPWVTYNTGAYRKYYAGGGGAPAAEAGGTRWTDAQLRANPWLGASIFDGQTDPEQHLSFYNATIGSATASMKYGNLPDRQQWSDIETMHSEHAGDPRWEEKYADARGFLEATLAERLSPQQQGVWKSEMGGAAASQGDPWVKAQATAALEHFEALDKNWQDKPIRMAAQTGLVPPLAPLNVSDPKQAIDALGQRGQAADTIMARRGEAVSALEGQDLNLARQIFQFGTLQQQLGILEGMRDYSPATLNATLAKIGKMEGQGGFAIAIGLNHANHPEAAQAILKGKELLGKDPEMAPKGTALDGLMQDALPPGDFRNSDARAAIADAARAVYATLTAAGQGKSGDKEADKFKTALDTVTGGVIDYRGGKVLAPDYGAKADDLDRALQSVTDDRLADARAPDGTPITSAQIRDSTRLGLFWGQPVWQLESVGGGAGGLYAVRSGDSYVMDTKTGKPFVLNLSGASSQPLGQPQRPPSDTDLWRGSKSMFNPQALPGATAPSAAGTIEKSAGDETDWRNMPVQ